MNYFTRNQNVIKKTFIYLFFFLGGGGVGDGGRGAKVSDFFLQRI